MEIQYPLLSLSVTILLLLPLFILIKRLTGPKSTAGNKRLPPGPWKLPVLGNMHQMLSGGGLPPHHVLRDLSTQHGRDLMLLRLGEIDHVVVSSAEAAREIMKTHDLAFCSRPPLIAPTIMCYDNTDIACAPYGGYWRQMRKICTLELLSARRVKASFSVREEQVSALVKSVSAATGSAVNLSERLMSSADAVISRTAFGSKCSLGGRFVTALRKTEELASGFNLADLYPSLGFLGAFTGMTSQLKKAHGESDEILNQIVDEHRTKRDARASAGLGAETTEGGLVDVLLSIKEKGDLEFPLTETNIKAVLMDMFSGGASTISGGLGWTMAELMRHPEVMEKAQSEVRRVLKEKERIEDEDLRPLNYTKQVIREALRLHPPFPLIARACNEPCTVMGYHVAAGSRVLVNAWAIGRDARYWEDGEIFKPERFGGRSMDVADGGSFDYLPFGGGRRACPGTAFAVASLEHALANLLFHFDWELPGGMKPGDVDMTETFGASARRKSDLFLIAKSRDFS